MPVLALNSGRMYPNSPESWVDVVEETTIDLSCAKALAREDNTGGDRDQEAAKQTSHFLPKVHQTSSSPARNVLASPVCGVLKNDDAGPVSITRPRCSMHDVARQPPGFAEIMGCHHHLDAAPAHRADDVLDGLGGGGIEARGRLVEEQYDGVAGERARKREALLFAARQPAGGTIRQRFEADQREKLADPALLFCPCDGRSTQRIADIAACRAPEHCRALEYDGAARRRDIFPPAPRDAPLRWRHQAHRGAQQRAFPRAVWADQYGRRP